MLLGKVAEEHEKTNKGCVYPLWWAAKGRASHNTSGLLPNVGCGFAVKAVRLHLVLKGAGLAMLELQRDARASWIFQPKDKEVAQLGGRLRAVP